MNTETLISKFPAIGLRSRSPKTSDKYCFISTLDVIEKMEEREWIPIQGFQKKSRTSINQDIKKHGVRFRHRGDLDKKEGEVVEMIYENSHDASSSHVFRGGVFRFICSNGLVISKSVFEEVRIRHQFMTVDEIFRFSDRAVSSVSRIQGRMDYMKNRMLDDSKSMEFASRALMLRYGSVDASPISPSTLLNIRRDADGGLCLWNVFNVIQENLIRGGQNEGRVDRWGRKFGESIPIKSLDRSNHINQGLWDIAESYCERN